MCMVTKKFSSSISIRETFSVFEAVDADKVSFGERTYAFEADYIVGALLIGTRRMQEIPCGNDCEACGEEYERCDEIAFEIFRLLAGIPHQRVFVKCACGFAPLLLVLDCFQEESLNSRAVSTPFIFIRVFIAMTSEMTVRFCPEIQGCTREFPAHDVFHRGGEARAVISRILFQGWSSTRTSIFSPCAPNGCRTSNGCL